MAANAIGLGWAVQIIVKRKRRKKKEGMLLGFSPFAVKK